MQIIILVPTLYIVSFILSLYYVVCGKLKFSQIGHYLFVVAICTQIVLLGYKEVDYSLKSLEVNLFVITFLLSISSYLFIRPKLGNLYSLFVSPVAFVLTIPIIFDINQNNNLFFDNRVLISHVLLNLLSHTILLVSAIFSLMFLYQHANIKNKKIHRIDRLPSLSLIERVNFWLISSSFPLMTIGFVLGFVLSKNQIGKYWFGTVATISALSWSIYFILILLKPVYKISGLKIAYLSILGFITIVLGYVFMYLLDLPSHNFTY